MTFPSPKVVVKRTDSFDMMLEEEGPESGVLPLFRTQSAANAAKGQKAGSRGWLRSSKSRCRWRIFVATGSI